METFLQIALYWDVAMWLIGAVVTTGALVVALKAIYRKLFGSLDRVDLEGGTQ